MLHYFPPSSPTGATVLAALRMWQQASAEERFAYLDITTNGGAYGGVRSSADTDAICEAFAHGGLFGIEIAGGFNGTGALKGDALEGAIAPAGKDTWHFAGARDGDFTYGLVTAPDEEAARAKALAECGEYHNIENYVGAPDEAELDGFAVWQEVPLPERAAPPGVLRAYRKLHDGLSDMVECGRLSEIDLPDDYQWLADSLAELAGLDANTGVADSEVEAPAAKRAYLHDPEACPSNHWNPGDDICSDCGTDLQK